ncbi:secretion system apparatus [Pandoraea terrae]|uniref:Secretion system apparatus n=1 Tax=Pandoraea terrae TaxID=1537710 RepID=A0A5E4ZFT3_9BURK|nr:hypothetical protein [Pandoraea terrae]VVE59160.1 secretion system apparatus [Pandoraea terrae]
MDLQTQRKLEKFFELTGIGVVRCEAQMEVRMPPLRLFVDATEGRVTLALTTLRRTRAGLGCLPSLLGACQPEWACGVPVRACCPAGRPMLIAAPPVACTVGDWLACFEGMRRVLIRLAVAPA